MPELLELNLRHLDANMKKIYIYIIVMLIVNNLISGY